MAKLLVFLILCSIVYINAKSYGDAGGASAVSGSDAGASDGKNRGEGWVHDEPVPEEKKEEEPLSEDDWNKINHVGGFDGKGGNHAWHPEPIIPRIRNDGPAPAAYPKIKMSMTNEASFGGKGGFSP